MKNLFLLFVAVLILVLMCFGCSFFGDDYDHLYLLQQSGGMMCVIKERFSAEYVVKRPLTRGELFLRGFPYKSEEFPQFTVRKCSSINDKLMSLTADEGTFLWYEEAGEAKLKKIDFELGNLSNDLQWGVTANKRINLWTREEIPFKAKLPSEFLGNSPDWKTIITEGENLVEKNLISLYVFDLETGISSKRFVRRENYLFMLNRAHGLNGIGSSNLWISDQFRWLPDRDGKFQLIYPVLEPVESKK